MLVWLAMTTGARRGELCALCWDRIDFATGVLDIRTAVAQINTRTWEKDTKTHQRRRIVADPQTLALLRAYLQHVAQAAASLGVPLAEGSFEPSGDRERLGFRPPRPAGRRCQHTPFPIPSGSCSR
jgi:integrase